MQAQEYLFQRIREQLPATASLADTVAALLHVSTDSAYRRIRGETPLVLEETRLLCAAFSISLDGLLQSTKATVAFTAVAVESGSFEHYLQGIRSHLQQLSIAKQKEVMYLTKDIPLFYNFLFPPLFAFRYFFWMKSIVQQPDFSNTPFSLRILPPGIAALGREIAQLYQSIPATEIWNTECVNSTIAQVEYYREAGYLKAEDAGAIYASLHDLIAHIKLQAAAGAKFLPGQSSVGKPDNYRLFYNRVALGDNTILSFADDRPQLFLSYDVLNYISTQDAAFCAGVRSRLQMLMRRSTLLSHASDKQRQIFFNILLKKIPRPAAFTSNPTRP